MSIRHHLFTTFALFGLATFSGACGDSQRTQEFCTMLCACSPDEGVAACTENCTTELLNAELETGDDRFVTDECFSCVQTNTCESIEYNCASACRSLSDPQPEPEPEPFPGNS